MSSSISDKQKELINEIAIREGFKDFKVDYIEGSIKGDGYTGRVTVVKITENCTEKKLDIVVKAALKGDDIRDKLHVDLFYGRENYMYSVIHKDFRELEKQYSVKNPFCGVAKYYGHLADRNEECLVLEDLREKGFKLWNRRTPMDSDHVKAVFAQYAKYHALSYAMKKLKPDLFLERSKNLPNLLWLSKPPEEEEKQMKSIMHYNFKAVEGFQKATAALKRFEETRMEFFSKTMKTKDKYSVILHADCWCNNMMFKYKETDPTEILEVNFLDWQLSSEGSPLLDLCYFFYACSSKDCMDNYQSFMKVYHESLGESLKEFKIDVNEIMSFKELEDQWRIFARYGMHMAFLLIRVMLTEVDEVKDFDDVAKEDDTVKSFMGGEISNRAEYVKRIVTVVNHLVDNNFL